MARTWGQNPGGPYVLPPNHAQLPGSLALHIGSWLHLYPPVGIILHCNLWQQKPCYSLPSRSLRRAPEDASEREARGRPGRRCSRLRIPRSDQDGQPAHQAGPGSRCGASSNQARQPAQHARHAGARRPLRAPSVDRAQSPRPRLAPGTALIPTVAASSAAPSHGPSNLADKAGV